jgi:hypothetical protein
VYQRFPEVPEDTALASELLLNGCGSASVARWHGNFCSGKQRAGGNLSLVALSRISGFFCSPEGAARYLAHLSFLESSVFSAGAERREIACSPFG